jgi:hypothetical protein
MILRGTLIHRDGHGKCGLLSPAFHRCLTPFIASPLAQQSRQPHVDYRQPSVAVRRSTQRMMWRVVTRLVEERTRMGVMRESAL